MAREEKTMEKNTAAAAPAAETVVEASEVKPVTEPAKEEPVKVNFPEAAEANATAAAEEKSPVKPAEAANAGTEGKYGSYLAVDESGNVTDFEFEPTHPTLENTFMDVVNNYFESSWTPPETILSASDQSEINEKNMIYDDMVNYVQTNPMFDETDKKIFNGNFIYRKSIKKISDDLNMDYSVTTKKKYEIMYKLKSFLHKKYGIDSLGDIQ